MFSAASNLRNLRTDNRAVVRTRQSPEPGHANATKPLDFPATVLQNDHAPDRIRQQRNIQEMTMAKLWDKGYELNKTVEQFTVGDDYQLDMELVRWDCVGSIAHAKMLSTIGVLTDAEFASIRKRLG